MSAGADGASPVNPFRRVGEVVSGDGFIGRADLIAGVQATWRVSGRPLNLRVMGHHRIGKSSLVKRAIRTCPVGRADLTHIVLNVGTCDSATDLFRTLSRRLVHDLAENGSTRVADIDLAVQRAEEWYDLRESVRDLLNEVGKAGRYVVLVLDEFDRASAVFDGLAPFQLLRDLASEPEFPLGLITVSRRPIETIETDTAGGSILGGVVPVSCYVAMFDDSETDLLLARGAAAGAGLASLRDAIVERCGRHPFLLELLCNRIVAEHMNGAGLSAEHAYRAEENTFADYFTRMMQGIRADAGERGIDLVRRIAAGAAAPAASPELAWLQRTGVVHDAGERPALFSAEFGRRVLTDWSVG